MAETFHPQSAEETRAIVADALAAEQPLDVQGGGSRQFIGRPMKTLHTLSASALSGVSLYQPEELVLRAGPGTPLSQIRMQLDQHGQMLAFEPPDYGPLVGTAADAGSLGGIIAGNLAGPRRIKAGAARDHFLGVEAVSGRGELFKSGGRVVKNVTGYDLCKLMAGSWGTLGVMTDITVKVLPAPEKTRTVLIACNEPSQAVAAMNAALSSPHDISAAAWVPGEIAARSAVSYVAGADSALAALRIEGIGASVDARCTALRDELAVFGDVEELHSHNSASFWEEIRDVRFFADDGSDTALWRISVAPADAADLLDKLHAGIEMEAFMDWGGGLIWARVARMEDAGSYVIRRTMGADGGHATLIRGNLHQRSREPVFHPESATVAKLTRNIKDAFDPNGILNPGRMYEGV